MTTGFDRPYTDPAIRREASHIARRHAGITRMGATISAPVELLPDWRADWYVDTHSDAGRTAQ